MKPKIVIVILLLILLGINTGNEPVSPPYYDYLVSGKVVCDTLDDKSNFPVALFGKVIESPNDSSFILVRGMGFYNESPVALTNSEGTFHIKVNSPILFDSLMVSIIYSNNTLFKSDTFFVDEIYLTAITETYKSDGGGSCSCSSVEPDYENTRTIKFNYILSNVLIEVCP